jgi:ergothioneine biosynthesis protein EgtB
MNLSERYKQIRKYTEEICTPLETEDYVVQPVVDVSPPKWHLGHTTWFFETFLLIPYCSNYQVFNADYNYVFNSYYETIGNRVIRTDRGNLSRPSVSDIYKYRSYVDEAMIGFLAITPSAEVEELLILGFNHEQQHQELLLTDIKYILGNNPLFPAYAADRFKSASMENKAETFFEIPEGLYEIGYEGIDFCFDNELNRHKVYLQGFSISVALVTNAEYLEFMDAGGYSNFNYWHAEGWDWVTTNQLNAPMYWHFIDGQWFNYTYQGLSPVDLNQPLAHISYYEAYAYANWKGMRLPTEFEWEAAAVKFNWGERWEWTESAYLPYPGFSKAPGAIGEYNGKFMVNQKVLRGASVVTPDHHSRITYRNFFHPHLRWQFTGIRLAK